jgi:sulfate/thiosulfate transport system ATP-binding protein
MTIDVIQISKSFGQFQALDRVNLTIEPGELVALLGPSGSGKTTLLRVIAGLERADQGQVLFSGEDATDRDASDRGVGFVFQHYALFRHMTIFENVAFGLRVRPRQSRPKEAEIRERVFKLLKLVQLDWLAERFPHQLSGGQRQRIALARALAIEPKVLLLDEPFGALDAKVRKELRRWLRRLHDEIHVTSVFVTHDQEEALEVADRVVVFNHGRIEQVGTPRDVYENPASAFVYEFLGHSNRFDGQVVAGVARLGPLSVPAPEMGNATLAQIFARPHEVELSRHPLPNSTPARIDHIVSFGGSIRVELVTADLGPLVAEVPREAFQGLDVGMGDSVHASFRHVRLFPKKADAVAAY